MSDCTPQKAEEPTEPLRGIPEALAEAIRRRGFVELTSVQRAVLDASSEGRGLRVSSQTGSGKTVAMGLALAHHLPSAPSGTLANLIGGAAARAVKGTFTGALAACPLRPEWATLVS